MLRLEASRTRPRLADWGHKPPRWQFYQANKSYFLHTYTKKNVRSEAEWVVMEQGTYEVRTQRIRGHFCSDLLDLNVLCLTDQLDLFPFLLEFKIMAEKIRITLKFTDNFGNHWNLVHEQLSPECFSDFFNVQCTFKISFQIEIVCLTFTEIVFTMKAQTSCNKCLACKFGLKEHSWKNS